MIKSPFTKLFTFLLALSLLNSSLSVAMISPLATADKDTQDKLKGEQDAEGSQAGLQDLSDALSDAQGLDKKAKVSLYDGSQVNDDTQIKDGTDVNKQQAVGAYHEKGNGIHVNTDRTDMSNSQSTVATLVHEQTRHRQSCKQAFRFGDKSSSERCRYRSIHQRSE